MSTHLNQKLESAEQGADSDFSSNSNKEIKFIDEEFFPFIKPFEQKGNHLESDYHLNYFRTRTGETLLVPEIPNVLIDEKKTIFTLGEGKLPYYLTNHQNCEELTHSYLFPT